jgi:hypothetical protein
MNSKIKKLCRTNRWTAKLAANIKYVAVGCMRTKKKQIDDEISHYRKNLSGRKYSKLVRDILFCQLYYRTTIAEYFYFGFESLSDIGRKEYISDSEVLQICNQITRPEIAISFRDKYKAYLKFKPFYRRTIIKAKDASEKEIQTFIQEHPCFLIKPLDQSKGAGIQKIHSNLSDEKSLQKARKAIRDAGNCILEEEIIQAGLLNDLHPASVNTVRLATYLTPEENVIDLYAMIRIGCGNRTVDNISSGGIFANIDLETGIISSPAFDLYERQYRNHPDTTVPILGQQIPEWESLKQIAAEAARILPEQKYVGWDFAYSRRGWIIVEANHRPATRGPQVSSGQGLRRVIESTIKQEV